MNRYRYCPTCNKEFVYSKKIQWEKACKKNCPCKDCCYKKIWKHNCPNCDKESFHTKYNLNRIIKSNSLCMSCIKKETTNGENNAFYGRKHSDETKKKISEYVKFNPVKKDFKKISENMLGDKNPMFGKSIYKVWLAKYGEVEANNKLNFLREKRSFNALGSKNPMFGKPTPQGSGNGWSGWYNNFFFRSLRELSYIIMVLEKELKEWKSAEYIKIPYLDWNGIQRTYRPDFIVNDVDLIEIKPIKLHESPLVQLKCKAAEIYCKNNNLVFSIVDQPLLELNEIKKFHENGILKFTKKYEERFLKYYE